MAACFCCSMPYASVNVCTCTYVFVGIQGYPFVLHSMCSHYAGIMQARVCKLRESEREQTADSLQLSIAWTESRYTAAIKRMIARQRHKRTTEQ